jgi:hypothetical protein
MAIPVATALIDGVHTKTYEYEALGTGLPLTLTGDATLGDGSSIVVWEWSIIATDPDLEGGIPEDSSLAVGTHGDFTNGKASVQNPTITADVPGGYCFSLRVQNDIGQWSEPDTAKNGEYQAIVYIKTTHGVKQPPANQKRYQDDLNQGLQRLEDLAAGVAATGSLVRVRADQPASSILITGSYTQFFPSSTGSSAFTIPTSGRYRVTFSGVVWGNGATGTAQLEMRIDEGAPEAATVGGDTDDSWRTRVHSGNLSSFTVVGEVELLAGAHTLKVYGKTVEGTGPTVFGTSVAQGVDMIADFTLVSGSGAGGVLVSEGKRQTDWTNTPGANVWVAVPEVTVDVDVVDGERVMLSMILSGSAQGTNTDFYAAFTIDGSRVDYRVFEGLTWTRNMSHVYLTSPLSEGPHTFAVQIMSSLGGTLYVGTDATIQVTQFRGGLVPVESDGALVTSTPRALNFIGAGVSVTDTDGRADIQLNEALTAAGFYQTEWANGATISGTVLVVDAANPGPHKLLEQNFEVPSSGDYNVVLSVGGFARYETSDNSVNFYVVFDEGTADEVVVPGNTSWSQPLAGSSWVNPCYEGKATLAAGTRQVRAYVVNLGSGASNFEIGGSATEWQQATYVGVSLRSVTGSGAGGTLLDEAVLTANQAIAATTNPPTTAVPNLGTLTLDCSVGEVVELHAYGPAYISGGDTTCLMDFAVDGARINPYTEATFGASWRSSWAIPVSLVQKFTTTSTQHVVSLLASSIATNSWVLRAGFKIEAYRRRGGLVPVRHDGAMVLDKPAAWDFIGPNVQVTNVGGTAKVNFSGVVSELKDDQIFSYYYTDQTQSADQTCGAPIRFFKPGRLVGIQFYNAFSGTNTFRLKLWREGVELRSKLVNVSGVGMYEAVFDEEYIVPEDDEDATYVISYYCTTGNLVTYGDGYPPKSGGRGWGVEALVPNAYRAGDDSVEPAGRASVGRYPIDPIFYIAGDEAGYIQAENVPILRYNSASVVNALAQPGASGTLWLTLNDNARYSATSPLSVDLSVSGLGGLDTGSEAADTWYYVYAVPGSTSGTFGLVCSASDPSTGPTGWDIWRYLGFFRNDSSSNIKPFDYLAIGVYRQRNSEDSDLVLYSESGGSPSVGSWTNMTLTSAIPTVVASAVALEFYLDSDSGGIHQFHVEPGNPPAFTPTTTNDTRGAAVQMGQDSQSTVGYVVRPLYDGTLSRIWVQRSGAVDCGLIIRQVWDKYLTPSLAGTLPPAPARADTKLPTLTYTAAGQITVSPSPGEPTTVYQTLQDNKQRYVTGSLLFDFANGVADRGLDEGTEQASTWYYMYLVPESGNDNRLTVRASDNPPSSGPTGYTNFRYLGAFRNDGSSNIVEFYQRSARTYYKETVEPSALSSTTLGTAYYPRFTASVSDAVPDSTGVLLGKLQINRNVNSGFTAANRIWITGGTDIWIQASIAESRYHLRQQYFEMPMPTGTKQIDYESWSDNEPTVYISFQRVSVYGWEDAYLTGDRGGGGGLVASGGSTGAVVDATEVVTPGGGGVTSLALTSTPVSATSIKLWQDGVLMRRVTGAPSGLNEWYYNSGSNQAEFNDTLSSTWYYLEWEK